MQLSKRLTYGHSLLRSDVRTILEVVVLPLLLSLQVQPCQPAQVLSADSLVYSSSTPDTLPVVVSHVGPPVSLLLDIPQNHVLDGSREPWNLSAAQQLSIKIIRHTTNLPTIKHREKLKIVYHNKNVASKHCNLEIQQNNVSRRHCMAVIYLHSASRIHA